MPAGPAKKVEHAKKSQPAAAQGARKASRKHQITGTVEELNAAGGTLTVKGRKESVRLTAGEKVKLEGIGIGDKVLVKYSGDTALSVTKVKGKKAAAKKAPARKAALKETPAKMAEPMKKEVAPPAATPPPAAPAEKK